MKLNNLLNIKEFSIENKLKLQNKVAKNVVDTSEKKSEKQNDTVNEEISDESLFKMWWEDNKNSELLLSDYNEYKFDIKQTTGEKPLSFKEWGRERFEEIKDELDTNFGDDSDFLDDDEEENIIELRDDEDGRSPYHFYENKISEHFSFTDLTFLSTNLANSMEFYDSAEDFAEHLGSQSENLNKDVLKQIYQDYWSLPPEQRSFGYADSIENWSDWVLDNYDVFLSEGKVQSEIMYKGKTITKLFPSGNYEYYSDKEKRFLKFDTLYRAKHSIDSEFGDDEMMKAKQTKEKEEKMNLFGVAQEIDSKIPRIGSFSSYTKMIDPKTPKERPILNAGQFIDNDVISGHINRIEGNKVFIESAEKAGQIVEVSIKDAVKTRKQEKQNTAEQKITEFAPLKDKK